MTPARVLMYSSYFPPEYSGAALQAISLAKRLRALGHYIEFVTQRWPGLAARGEVEGFPVTRLAAGRSRRHRELRLWWNLARFLAARRHDFDIVHSHGAYYTDSIIGPLGRWLGLKSLAKASLAENDLHDLRGSLAGRLHRRMLCSIDACIAISRDLEAEYLAGGLPRERVHYLPNGVDIVRFRPPEREEKRALRARLGLPADRAVALYVGVFDCRKNIAWLMREWQRADAFGLDVLLYAVGPQSREDRAGTLKRELEALASRNTRVLRIGDEVHDVADLYRAVDLFVMPSLSEGLPNAVLEAMACGLPTVAANVSGSRELVAEGETGFLFEPDDPRSLRDAVHRALGRGGEAGRAAGLAARAQVMERFDLDDIARQYAELYAALIQ